MEGQQLSKEEQQQFSKLRKQHYVDDKTEELCLAYYEQYKSKAELSFDKVSIALKCALFMAEKSQYVVNVKGEKMRGVSLSLGQLLRQHKLDDVMMMLRQFSKKVSIADKEAAQDLANIIREIFFLITYHKKFDKTLEKLELKERNPETGSDYLRLFSSFAWLLYVHAKNSLLKKSLDIIENTCLLAHAISFMIIYAWDYLLPGVLLKGLTAERRLAEKSSLKELSLAVKEWVLELFKIRNMQIYMSISAELEGFFQKLVERGVVKNTGDKTDFLSPDLINHNYRKLDKLYEKALTPSDLDERIFFKERANLFTPSKFTPFARQGYANRGPPKNLVGKLGGTTQEAFSSHRILNYEMLDKQETAQKPLGGNLNDMKLPKSVLQSPSMMKVHLICSTPVTNGMEMFNYIDQKGRKFKDLQPKDLQNYASQPHDSMALHAIDEVYELAKKDGDKKTKQKRTALIFSFYKLMAEEYLTLYPSERDSPQIFRGLLTVSLQMVFFVTNNQFAFAQIEQSLAVDIFSLWKSCDFFLNFDKTLPSSLKLHLLDLETDIIMSKIWRDENAGVGLMLHRFTNTEGEKPSGGSEKEDLRIFFTDRLFRRLLHQTACQINQICVTLRLEEGISQNVYETLKHIFCEQLELLRGRHVDQIIMCSLYANCRRERCATKFQDIIECYEEINPNNKEQHDDIIKRIDNRPQGHEPVNLIGFYNSHFIVAMKEFVLGLTHRPVQSKRAANTYAADILQSPLKDIVPNELSQRMNRAKKAAGKSTITQTHLLYAYNESPMLRQEHTSFRIPLQSKKVINFDREEELLKKDTEEDRKELEKLSPRTLPNDFNRKFANWKPQQTVTPQIKHLEGTHTPTRSTRNAQNPIQEINQFCSHNPNAVKQPGQYSNQGSNMLHGLGNNQHKFTSFAGGINYTKNIIGSTRYDVRF